MKVLSCINWNAKANIKAVEIHINVGRSESIEKINEFFSLDFSEARLSLLQFYYVKQIDFIVLYSIPLTVLLLLLCSFGWEGEMLHFIFQMLFICDLVWIWIEFSFHFYFVSLKAQKARTLLWLNEWRSVHSTFQSRRWIKFWLSSTTNACRHTHTHITQTLAQTVHLIFDVFCHCLFY